MVVACLGIVFNIHSQGSLLTSLQACYSLDCPGNSILVNGAVTGSALNGSIHGIVTCGQGHLGASNTAMQFGGTSADYIDLPNTSLIKPTSSLTVSGWFYVNSMIHQDLIFTKNTCNSDFNAYSFMADNGAFQVAKKPGLTGSCGSGSIVISNTVPINTWHHVVFYIDNTVCTIIVDNSTPISTGHNIVFDYDTLGVILGGTNQSAAGTPFTGMMDNLRFYDRQLTATEITKLYSFDPSCDESGLPPVATFTASQKSLCKGQSVTYTSQATNNPTSFNWQFQGGNPASSSIAVPTVTYSTPGIYTVTLVATNIYGSGSAVTQTVSVSGCTSITGLDDPALKIYPNPSPGRLFLEDIKSNSVTIYDVTGKAIEYNAAPYHGTGIEISFKEETNDGFYFLKVTDAGRTQYFKIILHRD